MQARAIGESNQPLICAPLVGTTPPVLLTELSTILGKKPDIIEWRADFFENIDNTDTVVELANRIKEIAGAYQ